MWLIACLAPTAVAATAAAVWWTRRPDLLDRELLALIRTERRTP